MKFLKNRVPFFDKKINKTGMKGLSEYLLDLLGWEIKGEFPDVKKSIVIFAPHTSYWDGLYGKLYLMNTGINYKFLSKTRNILIRLLNYLIIAKKYILYYPPKVNWQKLLIGKKDFIIWLRKQMSRL